MEEVIHLWNVNQFMTKLKCPLVDELQMHYIQFCRNLGTEVELPRQNFGPLNMCSHCGLLWSTVDHKIRILRGKNIAKSVKKMIKSKRTDDKIPKIRESLMQKSIKNEQNTLVIKCSVCSRRTMVPLIKPKREKLAKSVNSQEAPQNVQRKKKKRVKDKTTGLNISGCSTPKTNSEITKKIPVKTISKIQNFTPIPKLKKFNIDKLRNIVNQDVKTSKRKSLHSFLTELS